MSDTAIRVDNLSKVYHIGMLQQRHDTPATVLRAGLRDAWADTANATTHLGFSSNGVPYGGLHAQWQAVVAAGAS